MAAKLEDVIGDEIHSIHDELAGGAKLRGASERLIAMALVLDLSCSDLAGGSAA